MSEQLEDTRSTIEDYLLTYGWMLIVVAILGGAAYAHINDSPQSGNNGMPSDFNYTESKVVVESATGLSCRSNFNNTLDNRYGFECCQTAGNYSFCTNPIVQYNESGPDKVMVR